MSTEKIEYPEINQRIRFIIDKYYNGSVWSFSKSIGLRYPQTINRLFLIDRRSNQYPQPTLRVLKLISSELGIRLEWLLTGEGDIIDDDGSVVKNEDGTLSIVIPEDVVPGLIGTLKNMLKEQQQNFNRILKELNEHNEKMNRIVELIDKLSNPEEHTSK